jgi:hypothetical protein
MLCMTERNKCNYKQFIFKPNIFLVEATSFYVFDNISDIETYTDISKRPTIIS